MEKRSIESNYLEVVKDTNSLSNHCAIVWSMRYPQSLESFPYADTCRHSTQTCMQTFDPDMHAYKINLYKLHVNIRGDII